MPFDKSHALPEGAHSRSALPVAALVLALSLFIGGIAVRLFPREEGATLVGRFLENEAVVAFLLLDGEE